MASTTSTTSKLSNPRSEVNEVSGVKLADSETLSKTVSNQGIRDIYLRFLSQSHKDLALTIR